VLPNCYVNFNVSQLTLFGNNLGQLPPLCLDSWWLYFATIPTPFLFLGPSPTILSVVLAYDTATVAMTHLQTPSAERRAGSPPFSATGLSGDIRLNSRGTRTHGVYFGILTFSKTKTAFASVLQPSDWILEDLLEVGEDNMGVGFGEYRLATSSIFSRKELLHLAKRGKGLRKCVGGDMEILTHDPFNQMEYRCRIIQSLLKFTGIRTGFNIALVIDNL